MYKKKNQSKKKMKRLVFIVWVPFLFCSFIFFFPLVFSLGKLRFGVDLERKGGVVVVGVGVK
jgi:hypothetical protein